MITACNLCDDRIQELVLDGVQLTPPIVSPESPICPNEACRSRPRTRSFRLLFDEQIAHRIADGTTGLTALEVDGIAATRRLMKQYFGTVLDAGGDGRPFPVDLRTFQGIEDASIHLLVIPQALDRVVELDEVFDAAARVLALNGLFAFHLDASRVRGGSRPPALPAAGGRTVVGLVWILSELMARELEPAYLYYRDPLSGAPTPWFLARRFRRP